MSEYRYYEFAAIDRPLNSIEMAELRAVSTRALITSAGFTNYYERGDLKADPSEWMRRYFDAFIYWAERSGCQLSLRLPQAVLKANELKAFVNESTFWIEASDEHWILNWALNRNEFHDLLLEDDGSGWLRRLIPLRDELLRGDLRPLYVGWLADGDALPGDMLEPELPEGLGKLSPAQQALAEFLKIDPDLIEAAKAPVPDRNRAQDVRAWLDTWRPKDMKDVFKRIVLGEGSEAERQVKSHYAAWLKAQLSVRFGDARRRRVAELRELAQAAATDGKTQENRTRKNRDTERQRQRVADLRAMMSDPDKHWKMVDTQAQRGTASSYDQVVRILSDLADGYALTSSREAFNLDLRCLFIRHFMRKPLMRRLIDAGLWSE